MSSIFETTPGQRLLPTAIDDIAENEPHRVWASIPTSAKLSDGFREVDFYSFAAAINRAALFLEATFGRASNSETIAYIGKSDMRYHVLSMAAAKTGYQILFSSHINSLAAHVNLLELTDCHLFLSARGVEVTDILDARTMKHGICPELGDLLDSASSVDAYPMQKTFKEATNDVFLILHTSGTSGLPKPIRVTHGQVAANDYICNLPVDCDCGGLDFRRLRITDECAGRLIVPFAPFHIISVVIILCTSVFGKTSYIFGSPEKGMGADDLLDAVEYGKADCAFCPPVLLEKYSSSEKDMSRLGNLSVVVYGGGVLSPHAASILHDQLKTTRFVQFFGATESGIWSLYALGPEDSDYLSIDACHMGIEWRPVEGDRQANPDTDTKFPPSTLYEPVIVRFKDSKALANQAIFHCFPDLPEYDTGDLFEPHPTRPHTWKYAGRTDDLILFHHGIKYRPSGIEATIRDGHGQVQEVLMWGDRHQQAVILVELNEEGHTDMEDKQAFTTVRSKLNDLIDQINLVAPVVAQISKKHVVFTTRQKPLPRTSKGTVRRKEAAKVYHHEIEEVYRLYGDQMGPMMSRVQ